MTKRLKKLHRSESRAMRHEKQSEIDSEFGKVFHELIDSGVWAKMTATEAKVYIVLTRHASYKGRTCFPSNPTIAREAGCHKNTASDAIKQLEKGLLIARWHFEDKFGNQRRGFRIFGQEDLEKNLKSSPILKRHMHPSKMGAYAKSRSRDKNGRFIDTPSMDNSAPHSVGSKGPCDVAAGSPCDMDNKERYLNRDILTRKKEGETN